ncbi:MAG: hypothetical protein LBU25_06250 [Treponema sp.]|nr:hypothetical protein [Treponema sp.]
MVIKSTIKMAVLIGIPAMHVPWLGYAVMQQDRALLLQPLMQGISWSVFLYWSIGIRKIPILYESNERGFYIRNIKTNFYDPDFIPYSTIKTVAMTPQGISLELQKGKEIALPRLGTHQSLIYEDIHTRPYTGKA